MYSPSLMPALLYTLYKGNKVNSYFYTFGTFLLFDLSLALFSVSLGTKFVIIFHQNKWIINLQIGKKIENDI